MGNTNRKGWNAAASVDYDALLDRRLFDFFQVSYNTDCCGFSMESVRTFLGGFEIPGLMENLRATTEPLVHVDRESLGNMCWLNYRRRLVVLQACEVDSLVLGFTLNRFKGLPLPLLVRIEFNSVLVESLIQYRG